MGQEQQIQNIGILIFPGVYQLDVTAPYSVFTSAPKAQVHLIWKDLQAIKSSDGLLLTPTITFDDCPTLDVIMAPGGAGLYDLLEDKQTMDFLRRQAKNAKYISSVCTGSLLLAASGVLNGYKATTHWYAKNFLQEFNKITFVSERVVIDRNRITGAGISSGIDLALVLAAKVWDEDTAKKIELKLEYDPKPPFGVGTPDKAPKKIVDKIEADMAPQKPQMQAMIKKVAYILNNS